MATAPNQSPGDETRAFAREVKDPEVKRLMLKLAASYDKARGAETV